MGVCHFTNANSNHGFMLIYVLLDIQFHVYNDRVFKLYQEQGIACI